MTKIFNFSIADLLLSIESDELSFEAIKQLSGLKPFYIKEAQNQEDTLRYNSISKINPIRSGAKLLHKFDFEEIDCYLYRDGSFLQFDMIPRDGSSPYSSRYEIGSRLVEATPCGDTTLFRFGLWMAYGLLTHNLFRIAIHSSVIVYKGEAGEEKAVLFLGESGTGKSTHTRLWQENIADCYLLNDDSPIISAENGKIFAYGSPWSGKTPCYKQHHCEIAAIVRLSQAPYNKITKLSRLASIGAIHPSCPPAFAYDAEIQNGIFNTVSEVLKQVPVYHLECLPDRDAALLVYNTLEANAN